MNIERIREGEGLITCLINRLQAEAPCEVSYMSYRDEGTSNATEKKEDLEADIAKHSSKLEAVVSTSSVSDTEVAKLQAENSVVSGVTMS